MKNDVTRRFFRGVFPPNRLPDKALEPGASLVVNACPREGCHWLSIMRIPPRTLDIFDPSGYPTHLFIPPIARFIEKHKLRVVYNRKPLQDYDSAMCGQHVILYILLRSLKFSRKKILSIYTAKKLKANDRIVKLMYQKFFK